MESVDALKRQRASVKAKISRIGSFVDSVSDHVDLNDALVRLNGLEAAWRDYEKLHNQLLTFCQEDEQEAHEVHFCEAEEKYYNTKAKLNRFIEAVSARAVNNEVVASKSATSPSDVKLPRIQLPVFSGNFLEWSSFRDLFTNIIHNNVGISASQKLHYLKSSLSGEAAGLLQSMDVTDANYTQAWDLLNDRYQNKRQLIQCHLKALFGQTTLHNESVSGLRRLIDTTVKHTRSLRALGVETEHWDQVLVFFLVEKLDAETRREWELSNQSKDYPTFKALKDYLESRCCALEASTVNKTRAVASLPGSGVRNSSSRGPMHALHVTSSCDSKGCAVCGGRHPLYKCKKFLEQSMEERKDTVRRLVLCFNCLNRGHLLKHCPSAVSCHKCKSRHHTLLHYENRNHELQEVVSSSESNPLISHCAKPTTTGKVILSTALVKVKDVAGEWQYCRVLLDSGSQASFISESCVYRLGLRRASASVTVEGIGQSKSATTRGLVNLQVRSRCSDGELAVRAFVMNKLSSYRPHVYLELEKWAQTKNINLADCYGDPRPIDIILGAELFSEVLEEGRIPGSPQWPASFNTRFGWVFSGKLPGDSPEQVTIRVHHANLELQQQLQRFWELEEIPQQQQWIPPGQWGHVSSADNPADVVSRGASAAKLAEHSLWWSGPPWLQLDETQWPVVENPREEAPEITSEQRAAKLKATPAYTSLTHMVELSATVTEPTGPMSCTASISNDTKLPERYSSLSKVKRITAWCLRFIHNTRGKAEDRLTGTLSAKELQHAMLCTVRQVQQEALGDIILAVQKGCVKSSRLASLSPYMADDGTLRVGGRLQKSILPIEQRAPMLLPKNHNFVELLVKDAHIRLLHAGPQATLGLLQRHFWIVNGRNVVRRILHKCHICVRDRGVTLQQMMGALPNVRIEPARPFLRCGIDYGGPFLLKTRRGRGAKSYKGYIALFVCFATKAVHVEAVGDLSTAAFLAAFRRFVSRRGPCIEVFSDNGSNFIGARNELKELSGFLRSNEYNQGMTNALANQSIQWHFIPPRAPHFGGLWEAGIKSVKTLLRRVIGETILTYEEFSTVLAQIEAVLNSRPLCALSADPEDLQTLTPGHFLIGEPLTALPDQDWTPLKVNRLSRWQLLQQLSQHFWRRWQTEYISQLHRRPKWVKDRENVQIGDLVLIKEEGSPPLRWPRGRVMAVHPGSDNKVRVVTIKTATGMFKRPIVKLCRLPND